MGCQIGRLTRHERHSGWRDLRRPLKFPNLIISLTRFSHVLEGYKAPLAQFGSTGQEWPRRLVREIRQIWGSVIRPVPSLRPRQCGARPWMCPPGRTLPGGQSGGAPRSSPPSYRQDPAQGRVANLNYQLKHGGATCRTRFSS